jgi:hypothetical protein
VVKGASPPGRATSRQPVGGRDPAAAQIRARRVAAAQRLRRAARPTRSSAGGRTPLPCEGRARPTRRFGARRAARAPGERGASRNDYGGRGEGWRGRRTAGGLAPMAGAPVFWLQIASGRRPGPARRSRPARRRRAASRCWRCLAAGRGGEGGMGQRIRDEISRHPAAQRRSGAAAPRRARPRVAFPLLPPPAPPPPHAVGRARLVCVCLLCVCTRVCMPHEGLHPGPRSAELNPLRPALLLITQRAA